MDPSENPTIKLNTTSNSMPLVGLGMWQVPKDKATGVVREALKVGYRLVVITKFSNSFFDFFIKINCVKKRIPRLIMEMKKKLVMLLKKPLIMEL
jgi:hypothetical protein